MSVVQAMVAVLVPVTIQLVATIALVPLAAPSTPTVTPVMVS